MTGTIGHVASMAPHVVGPPCADGAVVPSRSQFSSMPSN